MLLACLFSVALFQNLFGALPIGIALYAIGEALPSGIAGANAYAETVLQDARAFIKADANKKFQLRPEFTKAMDIFLRDRDFTLPNLGTLRQATTQATTALYLKKKAFTVGTTKGCSPSGEQSGSGSVALTWGTKNVIIKTNFKQHAGNEVAQARALANDLYNAEVSLWTNIDQDLIDYLNTNRSGVNAGGSGTFDAVNDIMAVTLANENYFYNLVTADMQKNNYSPSFLELHDTMWTAKQRQYVNQGAGNSANTAFQFAGFEFFPSNLITPGTIGGNTYTSLHYIVPAGGVAIVDWNDPLNRANKVSGEKSWTTMQSLLRPEFTFDVYKISDCADTSADGGGTQDFTETWEISFNYAKAVQPISVATETPIFKYGVMDDNTFAS